MAREKATDFIVQIMGALSNCSLYSAQHPVVSDLIGRASKTMEGLYVNDALDITLLGDSLTFNSTPLTEKGAHAEGLVKRMKKKGVDRILFRKGVQSEELKNFVCRFGSGEKVPSTPHISVGTVEVKFKSEGTPTGVVLASSMTKVQEAYQGISHFKRFDTASLEDAVTNMLAILHRETNMLKLLSPIKSHDEYTYVHATNVATLTMFQAESLGLKGDVLHETGLAGLLHDTGKMLVPREIIDKKAKLTSDEWSEMKKHPTYGAQHLGTLPDIPRVAVIAAFEHHMKFDGSGYPETKRRGRRQHIVSQLVALADFYDAMRTVRSYRTAWDVQTVIELVMKGSGTDFNPLLVDNFLRGLRNMSALS